MRYLRFILPAIAFILVLLLFLKRPGTESGDHENRITLDGTTICVATDIHYIAPELTDGGKYFTELIENADGKFMQYCEEITDSFVKEMITIKPEVVILSGDLTFNGAKASHEGLAQKLKSVEDAGRFFKDTSTRMLKRSIAEPNEEICSFFSEVNSAYFSGRKDKINWNESACEVITKESPFVGLYLQSVYDDGFCDDTKCEF